MEFKKEDYYADHLIILHQLILNSIIQLQKGGLLCKLPYYFSSNYINSDNGVPKRGLLHRLPRNCAPNYIKLDSTIN